MDAVSILTHVEFGRTGHREGAFHFSAIDEIQIQCHIKEKYFELLTVSICYASLVFKISLFSKDILYKYIYISKIN